MPLIYRRPDKLGHPDTILYEIYMLRFSAGQLDERKYEKEAWVYLEAFLLHFRNLIEFLGNAQRYETDLRVTTIWPLINLDPPAALEEVRETGRQLWNQYADSISKYLAHCTTKRIDFKEWPIDTMSKQIEPLLTELEKHLKPSEGFLEFVKPVSAVVFRESLTASTMIGTSTATAALDLKKRPIG